VGLTLTFQLIRYQKWIAVGITGLAPEILDRFVEMMDLHGQTRVDFCLSTVWEI
jgi:hypothetical protein